MPHQAALTVRAKIIGGKVPELKAALDSMGVERRAAVLLPFEQLPVHFARLFVLDDAEDLHGANIPATLVFLSDVDAPLGDYVTRALPNGGRWPRPGLFACARAIPATPPPRPGPPT